MTKALQEGRFGRDRLSLTPPAPNKRVLLGARRGRDHSFSGMQHPNSMEKEQPERSLAMKTRQHRRGSSGTQDRPDAIPDERSRPWKN